MKRRLDLAMSLIHRPQILFLDEPTTGLDPVSRTAVWDEVRRSERPSLGVTIFLTTQYLEEADELADRVGIIAEGTIAAEGTPAELKRTIGTDLIVAEVGGDGEQAAGRVARAPRGIDGVEVARTGTHDRHRGWFGDRRRRRRRAQGERHHGQVPDVAHADARRRVPRRDRRPPAGQPRTIHRRRGRSIMSAQLDRQDRTDVASERPLAHRSSAMHDFVTVAGRAIRSVFREPEFMIPALIVPVFFYVVNVGALQDFAEQSGSVDDFKAFQLPVAIIFAVTGISRASALVTDIQGGYFDRLLLTPIRRPMLLLGLMAADVVAIILLTIPVLVLGLAFGVRFETGVLGMIVFIAVRGGVGAGVRRISLRDRVEDRQPGRSELQLHPVLPVRLPHHQLPAAGGSHRMDGHDRRLQPGHLRARRAAFADHRLGVPNAGRRPRRDVGVDGGQLRPGQPGHEGSGPTRLTTTSENS